MALSIVYVNSFYERTGNSNTRKFLPYVPTQGFTSSFEQGQYINGFHSGRGWNLLNTASREMNYTAPVGSEAPIVLCRLYYRLEAAVDKSTFLRFESASGVIVSLRMRGTGALEILAGGYGDNNNTAGAVLATTSEPVAIADWVSLEVKVGGGLVQVWQDDTLTASAALSTGNIDRVTIRGQQNNQSFSHLIIATCSDASTERLGPCVALGHSPTTDYRLGAGWTPNGGLTHVSRLDDAAAFIQRPDDDSTYLEGPGGDELFRCAEQTCFGLIRAVAVNIAAKGTGDQIQPLIAFDDSPVAQLFGGLLTPESTRYAVQQNVMTLNPNGGTWDNSQLTYSAFGFRSAGAVRVSTLYIERVVDISGLDFDCGDGQASYIL